MTDIGFGDSDYSIAVYIANKPNMSEYKKQLTMHPLSLGEIEAINQSCGNGWRKVFNVYAKLLYCLDRDHFEFSKLAATWQIYRDKYLLQANSQTSLLFSSPQLGVNKETLHIICGKTHANALITSGKLIANLVWLDNEFAIDRANNLVVCPYFDYRQLSNIKIEILSGLLLSLKQSK